MNASHCSGTTRGIGARTGRRFGGQHGSPRQGAARPFNVSTALDDCIERIAPCIWQAHAGLNPGNLERQALWVKQPLYSSEERRRRDTTPWTTVQAVLAPLQFLVFAVSLALVVRYMETGEGYGLATASILTKTALLYAIMITGSVWEKVVFGKWLFARSFFWEDLFSILVLALQTMYLAALMLGFGSPRQQITIAMAAYTVYVINASQFLLKLRAARLEGGGRSDALPGHPGQVA